MKDIWKAAMNRLCSIGSTLVCTLGSWEKTSQQILTYVKGCLLFTSDAADELRGIEFWWLLTRSHIDITHTRQSTQTQRDRYGHTDTYRHTQTHTDTQRHTETHTHTHRHTETHIDTHRHTWTDIDTQTHTHTNKDKPNSHIKL